MQELPAWWESEINWQYRFYQQNFGLTQQGRPFDFMNQSLSGEQGLEVVEISNERFKTAPGWGQLEEWLAERLEIAKAPEYQGRSRYWVTRPFRDRSKPIRESKIETTFGVTWGEYSRNDIELKTDREIYSNLAFRLPEEKTLERPVHRYFDSHGKGIAFEFRAVSKDPHTTPDWLRDEGLNQMIMGILEQAARYPELYDKPIVTCYADENHIQLYEHWLNMKLQKETTPRDQPEFIHNKDGSVDKRVPWWYIEVSPLDLERILIERTHGARTLRNLNQTHPFKLPDGREAIAAEKAPISFDSNGDVTLATLEKPIELEKGIIAEKGATAFWVDRHLVRVSAIRDPYAFTLGTTKVVAPEGATLEWDHPLLNEWLREFHFEQFLLKPDFAGTYHGFISPEGTMNGFQKGMDLRVQALKQMERSGSYDFRTHENTRRLLEVRGSLVDPKIGRVIGSNAHPILLPDLGIQATEVDSSRDALRVRLARDFLTQDGFKAAAGSDLVLTRQGDRWIWWRIALGEDRMVNGISFRKGTLLIRTQTGIRAYDGPGHFKDYPDRPKW